MLGVGSRSTTSTHGRGAKSESFSTWAHASDGEVVRVLEEGEMVVRVINGTVLQEPEKVETIGPK